VKKDEGTEKMIAIETGNEVIWEEEENWKFRLPKYRDKLLEWIGRPEGKSQTLAELTRR
jgi:methionyl-tRNA synthetase